LREQPGRLQPRLRIEREAGGVEPSAQNFQRRELCPNTVEQLRSEQRGPDGETVGRGSPFEIADETCEQGSGFRLISAASSSESSSKSLLATGVSQLNPRTWPGDLGS
jgi:hypothetical protein